MPWLLGPRVRATDRFFTTPASLIKVIFKIACRNTVRCGQRPPEREAAKVVAMLLKEEFGLAPYTVAPMLSSAGRSLYPAQNLRARKVAAPLGSKGEWGSYLGMQSDRTMVEKPAHAAWPARRTQVAR